MAKAQTWTRNLEKKTKKLFTPSKGIVDHEALERLKRRAEDAGLIIHSRSIGKKATRKR